MSSPLIPIPPDQVAALEQKALHEGYLHRSLVGLDQFMNVLTGGDPDETISSRAARAAERGKTWGIELSKFLNVFQPDHGVKAQAGDTARADKVEGLEQPELESGDGPT
jgi:hypothetical protein